LGEGGGGGRGGGGGGGGGGGESVSARARGGEEAREARRRRGRDRAKIARRASRASAPVARRDGNATRPVINPVRRPDPPRREGAGSARGRGVVARGATAREGFDRASRDRIETKTGGASHLRECGYAADGRTSTEALPSRDRTARGPHQRAANNSLSTSPGENARVNSRLWGQSYCLPVRAYAKYVLREEGAILRCVSANQRPRVRPNK